MVSFIKPSAAANMKQYLMPSYGEIMKHALTCKAIGAEVCSSVWCEFVLVKVNMNQLGVILYLNMYVCKFEPIQHVFRQKAFCKESGLPILDYKAEAIADGSYIEDYNSFYSQL